ncbi:unnamed protein product [Colias eurytheme]|nr:unnamed protein product [Colias eurytheme]
MTFNESAGQAAIGAFPLRVIVITRWRGAQMIGRQALVAGNESRYRLLAKSSLQIDDDPRVIRLAPLKPARS